MPESMDSPLRVGDWRVDPLLGEIARDGRSVRLEARSMRLLVHLAARAGEVVRIDDLLEQVWAGVVVTPDSVYQAVTSLRRSLGDDAKKPAYIATVPRLGYRMVARVEPWRDAPAPASVARGGVRWRRVGAAAAVAVVLVGALAWATFRAHATVSAPLSIAVLPFLDLTSQAMDEEYVADGMTEEVIDDLGVLPGVRVQCAAETLHGKEASLPVTDVARALRVDYVLDGSVRRSDATYRVAARLLHAGDGHVVWTQSYDRPLGDVVALQKDLAGEITRSLQARLAPAATNDAR
ncbi:TolB-like protein/DNA-binding winged helix-turn-helix (wHTH) protein [Dokdonella fugitiva]|uniref:TolB-like protein/DNA-binding winged helix-turn-helix (WHTH) protein n=1 Tax=Dokdonella fugitiva TaxID=328517 RepID=A0A839ETT5_9GAMM|nr:winged helix-turn-helix domain-containing protein [Dokdonella fugitiva]MBA8887165.1 TolB-like protein/DNA-binding winged helix-turn-helix (wHTH) protein [Dokdonella fugitiva]